METSWCPIEFQEYVPTANNRPPPAPKPSGESSDKKALQLPPLKCPHLRSPGPPYGRLGRPYVVCSTKYKRRGKYSSALWVEGPYRGASEEENPGFFDSCLKNNKLDHKNGGINT